ncbi:hypothetical protein M3Y96_00581200 [Aphelenchoides besseyi]|nr:hypothetical protein M3Y96_00581200 [Aphelenchoides besseyi]
MLVVTLLLIAASVVNSVYSTSEVTSTNVFYELGQELSSSALEHVDPVESELTTAHVDVRGYAFDQLMDEGRMSKACKILKREDKNMNNAGLRNFLRVACDRRREVLRQHSECLTGMEPKLFPDCEQVCVRQFDIDSPNGKCQMVACVARCIDAQMRECSENNESLRSIYSEMAGSQLVIALNAENNQQLTKMLMRLPEDCAKLAKMPLELVNTNYTTATAINDLGGDARDGTIV